MVTLIQHFVRRVRVRKTRTLSALIRKPMLAATDTFDVRGHRMHKERKRKRPHRLKVRRAVGDIRARQTKHVDRGRVHLHEHRRVDLSNQPQQKSVSNTDQNPITVRHQPLALMDTRPHKYAQSRIRTLHALSPLADHSASAPAGQ